MKKTLAILLAAVMLIGVLAACGEPELPLLPEDPVAPPPADPVTPAEPATPDEPEVKWWEIPHSASGTLIAGYGAPATGEFIDGFGNSAYDLSIKTMLHGGMVLILRSYAELPKPSINSHMT